MSYHVKDFIVDLTIDEKAFFLIDCIDLLESVNYVKHIDRLENILMASNLYPPADNLNFIEFNILDSFKDCCEEYGLYISDIDPMLFTLKKVSELTKGFFDLICDESHEYSSDGVGENYEIDKIIDHLVELTDLDRIEVDSLIDDIEEDLLEALENRDYELLNVGIGSSYVAHRRLSESNIMRKIKVLSDVILSTQAGFDFFNMLKLTKDELIGISDLQQRAIEYLGLLFSSNQSNSELNKAIDDTIDDIATSDEESIRLRANVKSLMEEFNYV